MGPYDTGHVLSCSFEHTESTAVPGGRCAALLEVSAGSGSAVAKMWVK